ncbi:hypothetical protein [Arthrobacter sp. 754]|uniref:hypothetical protein n=1 Tax=Arthrobacter sp. 754 TaxID=3156315 RepID=UPI0033957CC7
MGTNHLDGHQVLLSDKAVNAVARHMYGEAEYDALEYSATKDEYRKKARVLLQLAVDAAEAD